FSPPPTSTADRSRLNERWREVRIVVAHAKLTPTVITPTIELPIRDQTARGLTGCVHRCEHERRRHRGGNRAQRSRSVTNAARVIIAPAEGVTVGRQRAATYPSGFDMLRR